MTAAKTIELAMQHARNGNIEGALRILSSSERAALSSRAAAKFNAAYHQILDQRIAEMTK